MEFLADILGFLAQAHPDELADFYAYEDPTYVEPTVSFGQIVLWVLLGAAINVLFGFWGKSRAEEFGVNPWIGFAAGFFFAYIGVRLVPLLRSDRIANAPARRAIGPPQGTNPVYQPPVPPIGDVPVHYPASTYPPAVQAYPQQPPPGAVLYDASHSHPQAQYAPPPAQYVPPMPQIVVGADGYFACPGCGQRVKAGRRNCMSCGVALPRVQAPGAP